ncbi:2-amino-4-hydroxy-6-hydroxymethyldihydropteridine diphosphokinase [Virgibacillus alimentarius]|uniref:2-amino-4-hydroxy-6-hydroxymethyldihydropteridine diphosphokinase n=1 Tax=Virgibacillus alimentarius TaxID=698769 RepID=A0ABS4S6Q8_9BACI|nr:MULTISPECIES: 2-amino-4-hydroxy-6-hydroxymethyldihydropteridine diphosphokinase [Virgibacillus]MBP2257153.1 2-amino-4-hydroxy-6-hydroxymethyldihydropteridine diphosphokinase [Virgibacillus alimentarius]HLR66638.1 2-amino-4-hydroxy-6-hydroxymethyldihydropteridine diphosphokinase [Virgibacillus sp.]
MKKAFIALGTNIGPRFTYLNHAISALSEVEGIIILKKSSIYETAPVGYLDQRYFLNMVIQIETSLEAIELLNTCQTIEQQLGRKRTIRFGPRTIDLDILVYNQENIKTERLSVPHPRMHERAFVLVPLEEIAPSLNIPTYNKTAGDLIKDLSESAEKDVTTWTPKESAEE